MKDKDNKLKKGNPKKQREKTKQHQISLTEEQFKNLWEQTEKAGFIRPSSYIRELCRFPSIDKSVTKIKRDRISCYIKPVKTIMNQINSGNITNDLITELIKEVDQLCREYK